MSFAELLAGIVPATSVASGEFAHHRPILHNKQYKYMLTYQPRINMFIPESNNPMMTMSKYRRIIRDNDLAFLSDIENILVKIL